MNPGIEPPVLLDRPAATLSTCPNSAASADTYVASPPLRRISSTTDRSPGSPRAETTTLAPLSTNRRAARRPTPLDAPITTTTCSAMGFRRMAYS